MPLGFESHTAMSWRTEGGEMKDEQAFPCDRRSNWMAPGMTLRDYFAAKAMQSFCSTYTRAPHSSTEEWLDSISTRAYMIADSMLKARNQ